MPFDKHILIDIGALHNTPSIRNSYEILKFKILINSYQTLCGWVRFIIEKYPAEHNFETISD